MRRSARYYFFICLDHLKTAYHEGSIILTWLKYLGISAVFSERNYIKNSAETHKSTKVVLFAPVKVNRISCKSWAGDILRLKTKTKTLQT